MQPHKRQPTRLPRLWDSPGKNTGVGCHFLLQCVKVKSLSRVQVSETPWTAAYQAPPTMGFSRQEYWSGVPLPSPQMSLDNNIRQGDWLTGECWSAPGTTVLNGLELASVTLSALVLSSQYWLTDFPLKNVKVTSYLMSQSSLTYFGFEYTFSISEVFSLLDQPTPAVSHSWYCLLFYLVVTFLLPTNQEANEVARDTYSSLSG